MNRTKELPAIGAATVGTGVAFTAAVASACCAGPALAPVFLSMLGASGLVAVSFMRPYAPWLLLASAALLAFGFRQTRYRNECAPLRMRVARGIVWAASAFWLLAAVFATYGWLTE